jgi:hypothetical protein
LGEAPHFPETVVGVSSSSSPMSVKRTNKRKHSKVVKLAKTEEHEDQSQWADLSLPFRLEQPIQTALYAKLYRLGFNF